MIEVQRQPAIWMWCIVIGLMCVVTAQEAQPYQYTPPRYNAYDRRQFNAPYSGYGAASLTPGHGDLIRFPDDGMSPVSLIHSSADGNQFNERQKKDNRNLDKVSTLM